MRSEIVFRAQDTLSNRYELCRTAAKVTRLLHFLSNNTPDAINDAFVKVAHPGVSFQASPPELLADQSVRAVTTRAA